MDWKFVIAEIQRKHDLSQTELAELAGCRQSTISDLALGRVKDPRYTTGARLVELLVRSPIRQPQEA